MTDQLTVIVNPFGGRGQGAKILDMAMPRLAGKFQNIEVLYTERAGHAAELAAGVSNHRNGILLAIGGDGTLHEVINGMMVRDKADRPILATLPAGSGNAFAEDIGCTDIDKAVESLLTGERRHLDLMKVKMDGASSYAFNIVGWGLPGDVGRLAARLRWMGTSRYTWASLMSLMRRRLRQATLCIDDERCPDNYVFVFACNTRFTGKGMKMAPSAKLDDGLIDLLVVPKTGRLKLLSLFYKVYDGSHINSSVLQYHTVPKFAIESTTEGYVNIDGEAKKTKLVEVEIESRALQFLA
jgi:diacylglycerol kinase (ATP)